MVSNKFFAGDNIPPLSFFAFALSFDHRRRATPTVASKHSESLRPRTKALYASKENVTRNVIIICAPVESNEKIVGLLALNLLQVSREAVKATRRSQLPFRYVHLCRSEFTIRIDSGVKHG